MGFVVSAKISDSKKRVSAKACVYIGTSGWMYKDWGKKIYPKNMREGFLTFLSSVFNTVEVNSSFYRNPKPSTYLKWKSETPRNFVFAVKMNRYITHRKRLIECRQPLEFFLKSAKALGRKLGPILIQLPPNLPYEETRLKKFLKDLKAVQKKLDIVRPRFAIEPRHETWFERPYIEELRGILKEQKIALVFAHSASIPSFKPDKENITTDFVYVRLHGPDEFAASRYGARRILPWAEKMADWRKEGIDVFAYFNNDVHGHAAADAQTLANLIEN